MGGTKISHRFPKISKSSMISEEHKVSIDFRVNDHMRNATLNLNRYIGRSADPLDVENVSFR